MKAIEIQIEHCIEECLCEGHKCTKCKNVKCRGFFRPRKNVKSGLDSHCRQCIIKWKQEHYSPEKRRAYYENHIDYERERNRKHAQLYKERFNAKGRERYKRNQQYELARRKRRYQNNKEHENIRNKKWYLANRERCLLTGKRWRQEHAKHHSILSRNWRLRNIERSRANTRNWRNALPGRTSAQHSTRRAYKLLGGGSYTAIEWIDLKKSYNNTCLCCGRKEPEIKLTADHIVPVVKHGSSYIWNIQPLCKSCNSSKGVKIIDYRSLWKSEEI